MSAAGLAGAFRVAGVIISMALATGVAGGQVPGLVGGLALLTVGRSRDPRAAVSLILIGCALGVGTLRWSTLQLEAIFGIQEVLGPAIAVGPTLGSVAASLAALSCLGAIIVWSGAASEPVAVLPGTAGSRATRVWSWIEVAAPLVVTTAVLVRPAPPWGSLLAGLLLAVPVAFSGELVHRARGHLAWASLAGAAAVLVVAGALAVESMSR